LCIKAEVYILKAEAILKRLTKSQYLRQRRHITVKDMYKNKKENCDICIVKNKPQLSSNGTDSKPIKRHKRPITDGKYTTVGINNHRHLYN
jgi:hypothetical protein